MAVGEVTPSRASEPAVPRQQELKIAITSYRDTRLAWRKMGVGEAGVGTLTTRAPHLQGMCV